MKTMFRTIALAAIAALAITGCIKHEPYVRPDHGGQGGHGGGDTVTPKTNEQEWSFSYEGREDYVDPDTGDVEEVERFHFDYKGTGRFYFRTIRQKDFSDNYNDSMVDFFLDEVNNSGEDDGVFGPETKTKDILFDRMRSGSWIGFMFEPKRDKNGRVESFDYYEKTFTIQEDPASEAYENWLGDWRVMSGTVGYDIRIDHLDNNFLYKITGWECGDAVNFQMDQEYLTGEFWRFDNCLYIRSQYLGSYDDDNLGTVDEVFLGNIFDSNGRIVIEDENIDVAQMVMLDKNAAELRAATLKLETNDGSYVTEFYSMQYFMWARKDRLYYPYNENAGGFKFPFTMVRLMGTRAESFAPVQERATTKETIHRYQPKVAQGGRNNVAKKAVRVK